MPDYYKILNVSRAASLSDVKLAYRKLALVYHPDITGNDKLKTEHFKLVTIAYELISKNITDGIPVGNDTSNSSSSSSRR